MLITVIIVSRPIGLHFELCICYLLFGDSGQNPEQMVGQKSVSSVRNCLDNGHKTSQEFLMHDDGDCHEYA